METNHRFYVRRAAEEAARAKSAVTGVARARHDELASHYLRRAQETGVAAEDSWQGASQSCSQAPAN